MSRAEEAARRVELAAAAERGESQKAQVMIDVRPPTGIAPSATTTIEKLRPARSRSRILSHTLSTSNGISGISTTSAVAATPAWRAMKPASRP